MKLGFFTMPMHPPGRNHAETLREDREAVILADRLGFSDALIGEHVSDVCESIPSCLTFIASVAYETKQIKLGSGTVNLPNNHPAMVAANVAMVDHMLEGRFLFGIGPGGLRSDMEVLGSKGLVAAARRGWKPISANFLQPKWAATHWPMYEQGCALGGHNADRSDWRVCKSVFVADDAATAQRYAKSAEGPYGFYYWNLLTKRRSHGNADIFKHDLSLPEEAVTVEYMLDHLVIAGTPNSVVDQLLAFRETVGDFGTLLYCGHDWADVGLARRSMELMANKVMPAVNAAIDNKG